MNRLLELPDNVSPFPLRAARPDIACVAIDWGSSSRRAYALAPDGACVDRHEDGEGLLAARARHASSLDGLLSGFCADRTVPVLVAGLAGERQGGRTVPFFGTDVPLRALGRHLVRLEGRRFALPGYAQTMPQADLLRGQAAHLLGLLERGVDSGWVVLPGMHSRWVQLRRGHVQRWSTFVSGELFELQRHLGTLAPLLEARWSDDPAGFDEELELARSGAPLSQALWTLRAAVSSGAVPAVRATPMLSGLLIGAEFSGMAHAASRNRRLHVIAGPVLRPLYARAAASYGWEAEALDADALFGAGMRSLYLAMRSWLQ